jgi:hypothetical protein
MEMIIQGSIVEIERLTHAGTEIILGSVHHGEENEVGELTHITVHGQVLETHIGNMVIPSERPVVLEMIPTESHSHPLTVKLLS